MARSNAYWSTNLYQDPEQEPKPSAPLRDLPPIARARFRMLRDELRDLPGVTERVRFMADPWKWAWEYSAGSRRLCWLHVMDAGIGATFTILDEEAPQLLGQSRLPAVITQAVERGQRTGPVRWCWVEFSDRRGIEGFLGFMRRKANLAKATPAENRIYRRPKAG